MLVQPLLGKPSSQTLLEIFKATAMSVALYTMGTNLRAGLTGIGQGLNGIGPGLNGIGKGLSCVGQGPNCRAPPLTKVLALGMKTAENVSTTAEHVSAIKKGARLLMPSCHSVTDLLRQTHKCCLNTH